MENNNENRQSADQQSWLDDILNQPQDGNELGPDEHAVNSPRLSNMEDAELERILAEDWLESNDDTFEETDLIESDDSQPGEDDESASETEESEEDRKIRPAIKKGYGLLGIPHILATVIWLALIVAIGVSLGRVLWVCCADVMAFGKTPKKETITITEEDTIDTIAEKLGNAELVRYPELFRFFAEITGKDEDISVGTFTISSELDYNAMINAMVYYGKTREVVDVLFPEGVNCAEIFKILEDHEVCTVEELEEYAANGELKDYWFLEGVERGHKYCLEGYMSPDTYQFYTNDEPRRVIEKFLNEFDSRFTDIMKENMIQMQESFANKLLSSGVSQEYIDANPLTLHQIVTLASIIQRETSSDSECYELASVFYNRLTNPNYLTLASKATVVYAIEDYFSEVKELTPEHLEVDSPYNTFVSQGIPPGPICNMGVHSMYAALEPNETNYYYFVYDTDNYEHLFASTYDEHMRNVAKVEE